MMAIDDINADNLRLETAADGTRYIAIRLHVEGASAVRVYVTDTNLSVGQSLYFSNATGTQVSGPFTIAGPTQTGEFLSDAIEGSDVIVELQTGPEGAADLPFKIRSVEAAQLTDAVSAPEQRERESWSRYTEACRLHTKL